MGADGDNRGLIQHYATIADVDQCVGGSQVDGQIAGKHAANFLEHAVYIPRGHLGLRSEEHTSELQSRENLVCRLLLEKKKGYGISALHRTATCLLRRKTPCL